MHITITSAKVGDGVSGPIFCDVKAVDQPNVHLHIITEWFVIGQHLFLMTENETHVIKLYSNQTNTMHTTVTPQKSLKPLEMYRNVLRLKNTVSWHILIAWCDACTRGARGVLRLWSLAWLDAVSHPWPGPTWASSASPKVSFLKSLRDPLKQNALLSGVLVVGVGASKRGRYWGVSGGQDADCMVGNCCCMKYKSWDSQTDVGFCIIEGQCWGPSCHICCWGASARGIPEGPLYTGGAEGPTAEGPCAAEDKSAGRRAALFFPNVLVDDVTDIHLAPPPDAMVHVH